MEAVGAVWDVAAQGGWGSPQHPGAWVPVARTFRDGHTTRWWVLAGEAGPYGPDRPRRLVIATVDPATLLEAATWYLATTLPAAEADLTDVVRLYGLRNWVEQEYKHVKHSLGWSQYQVRSDRAMRRHWALVQCAFACCWGAEARTPHDAIPLERGRADEEAPPGARGGKGRGRAGSALAAALALLARGAPPRPGRARTRAVPVALLARVVGRAAPAAPPSPPRLAAPGLAAPPL